LDTALIRVLIYSVQAENFCYGVR